MTEMLEYSNRGVNEFLTTLKNIIILVISWEQLNKSLSRFKMTVFFVVFIQRIIDVFYLNLILNFIKKIFNFI